MTAVNVTTLITILKMNRLSKPFLLKQVEIVSHANSQRIYLLCIFWGITRYILMEVNQERKINGVQETEIPKQEKGKEHLEDGAGSSSMTDTSPVLGQEARQSPGIK